MWRDVLRPPFFWNLHAFCVAVVFFDAIGITFSLFFRLLVLKDRPQSFLHGANGALCLFFLVIMVFGIHSLSVIVPGVSPLFRAVIWTFIYPISFAPPIFYLSTLAQALPGCVFTPSQSSWFPSDRRRNLLLSAFYLFTLLTQVTLISVAEGRFLLGVGSLRFIRVGLTISATNAMILAVAFFLASTSLVARMQALLDEVKQAKKPMDLFEVQPMSLAVLKLRQNNRVICLNVLLSCVYFLLLAYYNDFFTNLIFSKVIATIMTAIVPGVTLLLVITYAITDVRKAMHRSQHTGDSGKRSTPSASRASKKEEVSMKPAVELEPTIDADVLIRELGGQASLDQV